MLPIQEREKTELVLPFSSIMLFTFPPSCKSNLQLSCKSKLQVQVATELQVQVVSPSCKSRLQVQVASPSCNRVASPSCIQVASPCCNQVVSPIIFFQRVNSINNTKPYKTFFMLKYIFITAKHLIKPGTLLQAEGEIKPAEGSLLSGQ